MHAVALHELTPLPPLDGPCRARVISLLFYVYVCFAWCMCLFAICLVLVEDGKGIRTLELELWKVVKQIVGAEDQTRSSARVKSTLSC